MCQVNKITKPQGVHFPSHIWDIIRENCLDLAKLELKKKRSSDIQKLFVSTDFRGCPRCENKYYHKIFERCCLSEIDIAFMNYNVIRIMAGMGGRAYAN